MSKWFIIVLVLVALSSVVAVLIRIESRRKANGAEDEDCDLSADDFEIIE